MTRACQLQILAHCHFYAILDTGYVSTEQLEPVLKKLIQGGAKVIQFRAKDLQPKEIEILAPPLRTICKTAEVLFVINDFLDIAQSVAADILHIGQDDGSLAEARQVVGEDCLIGRSTHTPEQAKAALNEGFDYIGFGPLFPTPTKKGRPGIGTAAIIEVMNTVGKKIPVFCIGGITLANLPEVMSSGATRVVIVSDVLQSKDITMHTRHILSMLDNPLS